MKKISPEDQEVLLTLGILKTVMEGVMSSIQDAVNKVTAVKSELDAMVVKQNAFITEVQNAFNRLEAKLAAGTDTQPIIDALGALSQPITDSSATLDVKIAEASLEGQ